MRCNELHGSFGLDNLRWIERADPTPGPGEVVVKLSAAALNYRDLLMVLGHYNPRQPLPLIPGSDGVGTADGKRVALCFAPAWLDGEPSLEKIRSTFGGPRDGSFAEAVLAPSDGVVPVPDFLSDAEAATLPCAGVTAWNAVKGLGKGDSVLIQGTGGVSLFALQLAHALGARTIVTSSSDEKLARAKTLGASDTINYTTDKDWGKTAKKLTDGRGVDVVVEVGGASTLAQSLKAVRVGGTIKLIGVLSGTATELPLTAIFMQAIKIDGILVGSRADFLAMNEVITQHRIKPVIDATFPLSEARQALQAMSKGGHFGKIALVR